MHVLGCQSAPRAEPVVDPQPGHVVLDGHLGPAVDIALLLLSDEPVGDVDGGERVERRVAEALGCMVVRYDLDDREGQSP